jgi:hypothetical protein
MATEEKQIKVERQYLPLLEAKLGDVQLKPEHIFLAEVSHL